MKKRPSITKYKPNTALADLYDAGVISYQLFHATKPLLSVGRLMALTPEDFWNAPHLNDVLLMEIQNVFDINVGLDGRLSRFNAGLTPLKVQENIGNRGNQTS